MSNFLLFLFVASQVSLGRGTINNTLKPEPQPWDQNSLIRITKAIASGNITNCWVCHKHPKALGPIQYLAKPENRFGNETWRSELAYISKPSTYATLFTLVNLTSSPSICLYTATSKHKPARLGKEFPVCNKTKTALCKLRALYYSTLWPANISSCSTIVPMVLTSSSNTICVPEGMVYICAYSMNWTAGTGSVHTTPTGYMATSCLNPYLIYGMCTVGYLTPSLAIYKETSTPSQHKRGLLDNNPLTWTRKSFTSLVPWAGYMEHEFILLNLTAELEKLSSETGGALHELQQSLNSLTNIGLDNRIALDYLLAAEGGVCAIRNTACCTYINNSAKVETRIREILNHATWLKNLRES
ncbi:endogenous retrovirus group V member 1 Env polyprotein [Pipistrellus kuhlii]|uniref:Uncharacterized protein n=1 Tax=Pipistrellus kuhlii TaxID=59472 RepID=A0A7J7X072_PIPKU|nr:endogenous retrovirus group V member 1 Env polyprotein [Pipistrellus kuhlii]XP_045433449.1 endogenous retrovirus group V member 1 Env polyprotein [Pipistrellus kuhlii]KAF6343083.1 hypothetical protein mPipKuh1_010791 [Pipistrellus kuhlii]